MKEEKTTPQDMDAVLRRMLAMPPEPHKPDKKPANPKPKKKPA